MSDIFISYSTEDRKWVRGLAEALEHLGWSVWWDRAILPGTDWVEVIEDALDAARCVVVVWSGHSVKSKWVQKEARRGRGKGLIPVLMEDVAPPFEFEELQAADLAHWDGAETAQEFSTFIAGISLLLGAPPKFEKEKARKEIEQLRLEAEEKKLAEEVRQREEEEPDLQLVRAQKDAQRQPTPVQGAARGQRLWRIPKQKILRFSLISVTLIILISLSLVYLVKPSLKQGDGIEEGTLIELEIQKAGNRPADENLVRQIIQIMEKRLDDSGVKRKSIRQQANGNIVIRVDNTIEFERVVALVSKPRRLEFKLVDDEAPVSAELPRALKPWEEAGFLAKVSETIPTDDEILFEVVKDQEGKIISKVPLLVKKHILISGDHLTDARAVLHKVSNEPTVLMTFDATGAKVIEQITTEHKGRKLAMVLDGVVLSAPVIRERIAGGHVQISGAFSMDGATDIATALRSGALPSAPSIVDARKLKRGAF